MRPKFSNFYSPHKWLLLAVASTFLVACGDNGRDPILGTDGNVGMALTVTAVTPADEATGVDTANPSITATFSEAVVPLTDTDFTVTCATPCTEVDGTVTMNDANTVATFTLTDAAVLDGETLYSAAIESAISDSGGVTLAEPYTWEFTTGNSADTTRPRITATVPVTRVADPTAGVPLNTYISAAFSEAVMANTVSETSFTLSCEDPCVATDGDVSYDADSQTAVFTPAENLEPETTYTATITSSVTDLEGNELAGNQAAATSESDYVWEFTTGLTLDTTRPRVTITEPLTTNPGPTPNVPANTAINAVFSESVLPATVSDSTFTLTCESPCENPLGEVSYAINAKSAVFTPSENLAEDTTYTATIMSSVTDTAGNELAGNQGAVADASDYIWTFLTVGAVAAADISVDSTEPMDAGTLAFCTNTSINATFAVPAGVRLNPTTVNEMTFIVVEDADTDTAITAASIEVDVNTGTIATFIPQTELEENVTYRATIKGGSDGVKDLTVPGNELAEDYVWTFTAEEPAGGCLQPANLRTVAPFGSFGGSAGITNQGLLTIVNGDMGTTAVSTLVTGFVSEPGCEYTITTLNEGQVNGKIFTSPPPPTVACPQDGTAITEAIAIQARLDAEAAFIEISPANMPGGQNPGNENLGSLTLTPGIYTAQSGAFSIQGGDLTLDAQGNQNAVWVFQMATTLTVGGPGADFPQSVILVNGAQAKNIFWQVGSAATINAAGGGTMKGTIIAQDGVSISTAGNVNIVTLDGRALSLTASVTVVNTVINVPAE